MEFREMVERNLERERILLEGHQNLIANLPQGRIICKTNKRMPEYYYVEKGSKNRKYINKQNNQLLEEVRQRKQLEVTIALLTSNISAQEKMLTAYSPYNYDAVQPSKSYLPPNTGENEYFHERRIHTTTFGLKVRSKSEAIIAEILNSAGLDFRYEKKLTLRDKSGEEINRYPDFTFRSKYGEDIYYEHFGMLGVPKYKKDAMERIELYIDNKIIPSVNLLITAETLDGGIDMGTIWRTVEMLQKML